VRTELSEHCPAGAKGRGICPVDASADLVVSDRLLPDTDVAQALIREMDAMAKFNSWVLGMMENPSLHAVVRDAVHRTTVALLHVLSAHREWRKTTGSVDALVAGCSAFVELVGQLTA